MRTHACTALALCALVACAEPSEAPATAPAAPDPTPPTEETEPDEAKEDDPTEKAQASPKGTKTAMPKYEWAEGPPIVPVGALRSWLSDPTRANKMLKLPVVVNFDDGHLGIASAFVGVEPRAAGPEDLQIRLDRGAMGVDLMTRLREHCVPKGPSCVVWLRGTWGPLVDLPDSGETDVLAVREFMGLVAEDATGEGTHAQEAR